MPGSARFGLGAGPAPALHVGWTRVGRTEEAGMLRSVFVTLAAWGVALGAVVPAAAQTKLLRFPDIHGDRVVFSYAGDLWTASTAGGMASRLTAHPGLELFPRFSPDGSQHRVHGAVRRRRAGLRRSGLGRRAAAAHVLPRARPAGAAVGLRQPSVRLVPRRAGGAVPVAPLQHGSVGQPALPGVRRRGASDSPADARVRAPGTSRRTAPASSTRRCSATSGPGSATRGAGRRSSTSSTARPTWWSASRRTGAPTGTRCGSGTPSTLRRTGTGR